MRRKGADIDTITSDMLVDIMEESIRIFWRFVRADKPESKGRKGNNVELQNPEESQLFMEIRKSLQKVHFQSSLTISLFSFFFFFVMMGNYN